MRIETLTTLAGTGHCPDVDTCPSVHRTDEHPGGVFMVGKAVTDPDVIAAFAHLLGPGEVLSYVPDALVDRIRDL